MKTFDTKDEATTEFIMKLMRLLSWYEHEIRSRATKEGLARSKARKQARLLEDEQ